MKHQYANSIATSKSLWAVCLLIGILLLALPAMASSQAPDILAITPTDDGHLNVSWTDTGASSYTVYWEQYVDDFGTNAQQLAYRSTEAEVSRTNARITYVPGIPCYVLVRDSNDNWAYDLYKPGGAPGFQDGNWTSGIKKLQLKPRKQNSNGKYKNYSSFSAAELDSGSNSWGMYISYDCPSLADPRTFHEVVTFTNPDGYATVLVDKTEEYGQSSRGSYYTYYYDFFSMTPYFSYQQALYGSVPTGKYTWTLYWNGMYVNSGTFNVK